MWLGEWERVSVRPCICACVRPSVLICVVGTIQASDCVGWLSNFICKLFMMIEGTLLILVTGSKVNGNFVTLSIKYVHRGHETDYTFGPFFFKLHMHLSCCWWQEEHYWYIWSQGQRSTLAQCDWSPRFALSSYSYCLHLPKTKENREKTQKVISLFSVMRSTAFPNGLRF